MGCAAYVPAAESLGDGATRPLVTAALHSPRQRRAVTARAGRRTAHTTGGAPAGGAEVGGGGAVSNVAMATEAVALVASLPRHASKKRLQQGSASALRSRRRPPTHVCTLQPRAGCSRAFAVCFHTTQVPKRVSLRAGTCVCVTVCARVGCQSAVSSAVQASTASRRLSRGAIG